MTEKFKFGPLSKLAYVDEMLGDLGAKDHSALNVHEDLSTKSTTQLATEVEFSKRSLDKILVIGAGAWGTTLSKILASNIDEVLLHTRDFETAEEINSAHVNSKNLSGAVLPGNIKAVTQYSDVCDICTVVVVTPVKSLHAICADLMKVAQFNSFIICSKGIDNATMMLPSQICEKYFPNADIAVLSGPNFAKEIALEKKAKTLIATKDDLFAKYLQRAFKTDYFCPEISDDIIGVEVCGAIKNVIAIASGIAQGLDLGENFLAALMVLSLKELGSMLEALGGKGQTVYSLAGLGDLLLTCYSLTSRNTSFGYHLAKKETVMDLDSVTVEGYYTAKSIFDIAEKLGVNMPICSYVYHVLYNKLNIHEIAKLS
jgi:glycerol-3-phosphate dehydrogenase (NAD(P)+)